MRALNFVISLAASMSIIAGIAVKTEGKTFVVPHILDTTGLIGNTQFTFDTTFFVTYTGGVSNNDAAPGATVDMYFFDDLTGQPLKSATNNNVCNPCSFTVNAANRKAIGNVEGLANSVGGLPRPTVTGSMIFVVTGDSDNVDVSAFVVNSHTSAFDVSTLKLDSFFDIGIDAHVFTMNTWREDSKQPNEPFSFSTDLNVLYGGGLPGMPSGNGATVNLRLYDESTGAPLLSSTNQPVCNPCTATLSAGQRKRLFSFDQLIRNAGGFVRPDVSGFATVEVTGDTKNVFLQSITTNNHTGPNDVELHAFDPNNLIIDDRLFLISPVYEKQGTINNTPFTFDTKIDMTYTGGLPGFPTGTGATADLTIIDELTGLPMKTATNQDVCNPCTTNLTPLNRKRTIVVDDEIVAKGGFGVQPVKTGFGVIVVGGNDPNGVNLQGFVVNSHTGPLDLALFAFEPQKVREPAFSPPGSPADFDPLGRTKDENSPEALSRVLSSEYNFSHFRDRTGKASNTTFTFDSEFHAVYSGSQSATLELYLYDQATSAPLLSLTNQTICNPCSLPLNTTTKKRRIIIDDLITAAGGFPRLDVSGFAKIKVTGDAGRVGILGMLVNAHSGPNDLSTSELPAHRIVRRTTDFDINGDGRADIGVFRPNDPLGAMFYFLLTGSNQFSAFRWGVATDKIAPGDFDGDGKTDIAVWRPTGTGDPNRSFYYIFQSLNNTVRVEQFGRNGDLPLIGDWDGDGQDELAVYRNGATPGAPSFFFHRPSASPSVDFTANAWGLSGDEAQRGDFDGDGKMDAAVFRPSNGTWYIRNSADNTVRYAQWGLASDHRVSGDFDGDGKTDLAVWRPSTGTWYISQSSNGGNLIANWGLSTDTLVPADYDGDGRSDLAVWRPSDGNWYIRKSSSGNIAYTNFGAAGDRPLLSIQD